MRPRCLWDWAVIRNMHWGLGTRQPLFPFLLLYSPLSCSFPPKPKDAISSREARPPNWIWCILTRLNANIFGHMQTVGVNLYFDVICHLKSLLLWLRPAGQCHHVLPLNNAQKILYFHSNVRCGTV